VEDRRICRCDSCDWTGIFSQLLYEEACPVCDSHDVEVDEWSFGFSDNGNYYSQYSDEDLENDINSYGDYYNNQYEPWGYEEHSEEFKPIKGQDYYIGQFTQWDGPRELVGAMEIDREHHEGVGLSHGVLKTVAEDSALYVEFLINKLLGGEL